MHVTRACVALVLGLALAGTTSVSALADPAANAPPVTVPDRVGGQEGALLHVEPLANDSDPDGDDLAICRLGATPDGVSAEFYDDSVMIVADRPGTFVIDYYACDLEFLTRGTITVVATARPVVQVQVRKLRRAGRLRVVNHDRARVSFAWGSTTAGKADGSRWIRPGRSAVIKVRRHAIVWVAVNQAQTASAVGRVRHIRLPRGKGA